MMPNLGKEVHCAACGILLTAVRTREGRALANGCRCENPPPLDPTRRYTILGFNGAFTVYEITE